MAARRALTAGIIIGAVGIIVVYRGPHAAVGDGPAAKAPAPDLQVGRFQIAGIPAHVYVLDTATGKVWERFDTVGTGSSSEDFLEPKITSGLPAQVTN